VRCHGAPGIAPEPFALGLQPLATPLVQSGRDLPPRALYWIVKNGIKMTAMPAFAFRMDEAELWAVVAAVMELPRLSPAAYQALTTIPPAAVESTPVREPDPSRGKLAVGQYGCTACHAVPGMEGPKARVGPTLHGIASRQMLGGVLPNSPENMARWLRSPQSATPHTAMPDLGVTEGDARDMAAYLATLR
jgi:cytochrome c2